MSLDFEFSPIDVSITTHPKAFTAGVEAMGLWLWGMAHARRDRTGGRLHRAAVLVAWGGRRNIMLAKRLVDAGLWIALDNGDWDIFNFETKAPSSSPSAERMRKLRAKRKEAEVHVTSRDANSDVTERHQCSLSLSTSLSTSPPDLASPQPDPLDLPAEAPSEVRRRVVGDDGDSGALFGAWSMGIRAVTNVPQAPLDAGERRTLVAVANTHAGGALGQELLDWMTATAITFARQHDPAYGGFTPGGARKWLNAGRPTRASPRGPLIQPREAVPHWKSGEET